MLERPAWRPAPGRREPRVAIVHYWLVAMRGGERVLERLLALYPQADLFTHVYDPSAVSDAIRARAPKTSFIQRLPMALRLYQRYLPLMPLALEELDLSGYDLVISSESGPAKGVIAAPDALHICYCHSPMRYLWDHYPHYRANAGRLTRLAMAPIFHRLRSWDSISAQRVDAFVANSTFIRARIRRAWGRDASVVHPPVATHLFAPTDAVGESFLWVGQMVAYKRPDLAIDAFNRLGLPLLMVGDGAMLDAMRKRAGPNIRFAPRLDLSGLAGAYAEARALIFTAEEDFGIVPVEANAAGRPVIGYGRGGIRDSIVPAETGLFFDEQSIDALVAALAEFERWAPGFKPDDAVRNAQRFTGDAFDRGFADVIARLRPDLAPALPQALPVPELA